MKFGIKHREPTKMVEMFSNDETVVLTKDQAEDLFAAWDADDALKDELLARRIAKSKSIR